MKNTGDVQQNQAYKAEKDDNRTFLK